MPASGVVGFSRLSPADFQDGETAVLLLSDVSWHRPGATAPHGFHVVGRMDRGSFIPDGEVRGGGELSLGGGQPGWLELSTGQFHPMQAARAPVRPYVQGMITDAGFVPSSRVIH